MFRPGVNDFPHNDAAYCGNQLDEVHDKVHDTIGGGEAYGTIGDGECDFLNNDLADHGNQLDEVHDITDGGECDFLHNDWPDCDDATSDSSSLPHDDVPPVEARFVDGDDYPAGLPGAARRLRPCGNTTSLAGDQRVDSGIPLSVGATTHGQCRR
mmetsp:Transcript_40541/g.108169  ORF Transcript_40541/g.108169 Transcript_40541/m.108169 type:complete len:155 (-) Transcript_40541:52-516(-)